MTTLHIAFLQEEFKDMMSKGQWLVLPYSAVKDLPGLRLSPPGVVPQATQMDLRLQLVGYQCRYSTIGCQGINAIWPRP